MAQTTPDIEQLMDDYEDLWHGDFSKLDAVSESVAVYDPAVPDGQIRGRDALETYIREFLAAFPDTDIEPDDMLASDEVVMVEWTWTGTHEGEFNGIPPTHREVEIAGMSKILIEDGKVKEDRLYYDLQKLSGQLGLADE